MVCNVELEPELIAAMDVSSVHVYVPLESAHAEAPVPGIESATVQPPLVARPDPASEHPYFTVSACPTV
jgi:hypothetical protein